ncbi:hypothetical protein PPYR_05197 [Photinus pyralis]|uniref:Peptidase S1 domain-containing protein n=1 Tax=Photinus pyralis TaxID=7054 RepID=A0A5N4B073_PHOPY|nr:trypsin-1-like isoform X2 [Photinus pyralis]KAB0803011.1 hypothetical protein PPYR_05197 [Photinus pyralis]
MKGRMCIFLFVLVNSVLSRAEDDPISEPKVGVDPITNNLNGNSNSYAKPTTEQVEFEPGVPPGQPSSTTYPPGVSPPQPTIVDGGTGGVVDWVLNALGIKPNDKPNYGSANNVGIANENVRCPKCACGLTYKHNRIVGGVETQVNEYPWMVVLLNNNRFYCGGSVINNKFVLTAGHCVNGISKERLLAVFLDHDRSTSQETKTFFRRITKIINHGAYGIGASYNNDIALLELEHPISFDGILKPVCLPLAGKSYSGHTGIVTGWGATAAQGSVSNKLREVRVPILSHDDCQRTGYGKRVTENMVCAGYPQGAKDSCQGDSGGPMHVANGTHHFVVGIVSWGESCAKPNYPGVYTRVNRFLSWIQGNTKGACYCS